MNKSSKERNTMRQEDIHIDSYLNSIQRVSAPPFLFTRIRERVADQVEKVPGIYVWIGGLSLCILLSFNFMVLMKIGSGRSGDDRHVFANSINYLSDNNLYR